MHSACSDLLRSWVQVSRSTACLMSACCVPYALPELDNVDYAITGAFGCTRQCLISHPRPLPTMGFAPHHTVVCRWGFQPLDDAVKSNNLILFNLLAKNGAKLSDRFQRHAVLDSSRDGSMSMISLLGDSGADLSSANYDQVLWSCPPIETLLATLLKTHHKRGCMQWS